jgi:electron transfer flavoprotein beta subunit
MKVLVPFKRVPDLAAPPSYGPDAAQWVVNPFDENAVEEALRMKENGVATEVVAATIGTAASEEQIRNVLARGVDRAIRVDDSRDLDPYAVARILAALARKESPALVILGKQAVDDDANQVGQMLAALLGWPQATFVSKIEFQNDGLQARCTRETDRGLEIIRVKLPAVITCDLRLNEPRYVSLPGLMKARRRPIEVLSCEQLAVAVRPRTTLLSVTPTPRREAGVRVESVEELVGCLRDREKVL